MSYVKGW
ncbi:unnamed protein product [Lathyrus oleraceus]